jgi:alkaline phosphatase
MLSVADHECGGLSIGGELGHAPEYCYMPQYLDAGKHSAEFLQSQWSSYNGSDAQGFLKSSIFGVYGIKDPNATEIEIATAQKNKTSFRFDAFLGNALSSRALINWATLGHTGVDVNLLGYGPTHEKIAGNHDNTEIAEFIVQSLGLNLSNVTKILNSNAAFLENYVGTTFVEDGIVQKKSLPRRAHSDHHC